MEMHKVDFAVEKFQKHFNFNPFKSKEHYQATI